MTHFDSRSPAWLSGDEPLPPEVLEAIRIADSEDAQPEQLARLEARLLPLFQGPGSEALPAPTATATRGSLGALKLGAAALALVGVAALVWPQRQQATKHHESVSATSAATPRADYPVPLVSSLPRDPAPVVLEVLTATPPEGNVSDARAPRQANTLALEARMLSRARRTLERDPALALRLAEQHRARFPLGALSEEREAIAIKALRRTGNEQKAAEHQARFLARYPESPHALSLGAVNRAPSSRP